MNHIATRFARVEHLAQTRSTNSYLQALPDDGSPLVVVADYQTAGRGCGTNSWESEPGQNLLFSVRCRPEGIEARQQFVVSMAMALAVRDAVQEALQACSGPEGGGEAGASGEAGGEADGQLAVRVKWPNDIYVGQRKICGILIENRLSGTAIRQSICGVGLNVNQARFLSDAPNPVSLFQLTGCRHDVLALLQRVLTRFDHWLCSPLTPQAYRESLFRRGEWHAYRDAGGRFMASLHDVEPDGHLLLRLPDGTLRRYAFKEVAFEIGG